MNIETKSFDLKATVQDEGKGVLHAVVSVFGNQDSVNDVMVKGAFERSIKAGKDKGRLPPGVWSHDWERPVAKTIDAWETEEGLNVVAQFNLETKDGSDAYSNVKNELFTEYSFGFGRVRDAEEKKDGVTFVKDVNWYEWSPVLVGANRETRTIGVKRYPKYRFDASEIETEREFEEFLRDAGFPKAAAFMICTSGYKALRRRDAEEIAETADGSEPKEPDLPNQPEPELEVKTKEANQAQEQANEPAPVDVSGVASARVMVGYLDFQDFKKRFSLT